MVLIKDDVMFGCNWTLGVVKNVYPRKDDKVRVVDIKSNKGLYRRPTSKLVILLNKEENATEDSLQDTSSSKVYVRATTPV